MSNKLMSNRQSVLPALFEGFFSHDDFFPFSKRMKEIYKIMDFGNFPVESYPKCDVKKFIDHYEIDAAVPGLTKNDIKIYVKNKILFIECGKQETNSSNNDFTYTWREIKKSKSIQSFNLEESCVDDVSKYSVNLKDGILSICIPRINVKEPMQNEVQYIPINES